MTTPAGGIEPDTVHFPDCGMETCRSCYPFGVRAIIGALSEGRASTATASPHPTDGESIGTTAYGYPTERSALQPEAPCEDLADARRLDWLDAQFKVNLISKNKDGDGAINWYTNLGHWSEGWKMQRAATLRAAIDAAMKERP